MKRSFHIALIALGTLLMADTGILLIKTASRTLGIFMPFVLGGPLFIVGVLCLTPAGKFFKSHIIGKIIKWCMICGYAAFCLLFCTTSLLAFFAGGNKPENGADVLIVLGCGVKGERVTLTLSNRLDKALEYLEANPDTKVLVSGGQGKGEDISEALAMKRYLTAHGLDENRIITEDRSSSTEENFKYSKRIIDELFPEGAKVVFVTTRFHVFRAGRVAQRCGIDADGMGAKGVWYITFNDYLRECVGITIYFLTGKA